MLENYFNSSNCNLLVVGAGLAGTIIAERAAKLLDWNVLVIDKRDHIAGNCYDVFHESGLLIHRYGPHYFRTNNAEIVKYLSDFTEWIPGNFIVNSIFKGNQYPIPINLNTIRKFFNKPNLNSDEAESLLNSKKIPIETPMNSEEFVLSKVGRELYEAFYEQYTLKQWGIHPKDLASSVCGRIPIRLNTDPRYVDHIHQMTPANGFSAMFSNMLNQKRIKISLKTDYNTVKHLVSANTVVLYSGPIDEYFDYQLGKLPWRSLDFEFKVFNQEFKQNCVQINYPNEFDYTRSVEIKHITRQIHPQTVVAYERPRAVGDPFYPIPQASNHSLYKAYRELAKKETKEKKVFFCGRLAEYTYYNMDEVIERALITFNEIRERIGN